MSEADGSNRFLQGYLCAVATLQRIENPTSNGISMLVSELYKAGVGNMTIEEIEKAGVDEYDLEVIRRIVHDAQP